MVNDPLQFMPVKKWAEVEEAFKADLPRGIPGLILLDRERYFMERGIDYGFKVYCPYGDILNGIVAINIKKTFYEVIVQCPNDDTSQLEDALHATNIIDWSKEIMVPFASKNVMDCVKRIIRKKNLAIDHLTTTTTYVLDKSSDLFDVKLPPNYCFDLLSLDHLDLLDCTWPHRYPDSDFYFELLIKARLGYGLYREGKLISWVLIKESGALLHLFTLLEERRKGYGELVLKLISNLLRREGKYVVAYCVAGNDNAAKLYQKLNFENTMDVEWCTFKPSF